MDTMLVFSASDSKGAKIQGGDTVMVDGNPEDVREIDGMCRVEGDPRWDVKGEGIEVFFYDFSEILGTHRLTKMR